MNEQIEKQIMSRCALSQNDQNVYPAAADRMLRPWEKEH